MSTKRIDTPPEVDEMLENLAAENATLKKRIEFDDQRHPELVHEYADFKAKHGPSDEGAHSEPP